eukprot:2559350-Rhodomonas_salina.1
MGLPRSLRRGRSTPTPPATASKKVRAHLWRQCCQQWRRCCRNNGGGARGRVYRQDCMLKLRLTLAVATNIGGGATANVRRCRVCGQCCCLWRHC